MTSTVIAIYPHCYLDKGQNVSTTYGTEKQYIFTFEKLKTNFWNVPELTFPRRLDALTMNLDEKTCRFSPFSKGIPVQVLTWSP